MKNLLKKALFLSVFLSGVIIAAPYPAYSPTQAYVTSNGSNIYPGTLLAPYATVTYAEANVATNTVVKIPEGNSSEGALLKKPFINWVGFAKEISTLTSSGGITLDNTAWTAATNPSFVIKDMTLSAVNIDFTAATLKSNSSQIFDNVKTVQNLGSGRIQNLFLQNGFYVTGLTLSSVTNASISNGDIAGTAIFQSIDDGVPLSTITINNVDFHGSNILIQTEYVGSGSFTITITNCKNISSITYDDISSDIPSILNIDADSYTSITDGGTGLLTVNLTTDVANGISTSRGFSLGNREFSWDASAKNFFAGEGAHDSGTINSIILGESTSSRNNVFVAADHTGTDFFTNTPNKFAVRYSNGYSFGTGFPGAFFHVKAGSSGDFLATASSVVSDGNISNLEFSPSIVTDKFSLKYKGSTGTIHNYIIGQQLQNTNIFVTKNSTTSLSAADILSGEIQSGALSSDVTWTLPSATDIYAAMGSPILSGSFIETDFINLGPTYYVHLSKIDANLTINGLNDLVIMPGQTTRLKFTVTNIATPVVNVSGGTFLPDFTTFPTLTNDNIFTGTNIFSRTDVSNYFSEWASPGNSPFTAGTVNLTGVDVSSGIAVFNNTGVAQTVNFPTGSSFDAPVDNPAVSQCFWFSAINQSTTATIAFVGNTNFAITGLATSFLPPSSSRLMRICKSAITPAYVTFG